MPNYKFRDFIAIVLGTLTLSLVLGYLARADGVRYQPTGSIQSQDEFIYLQRPAPQDQLTGNQRQTTYYDYYDNRGGGEPAVVNSAYLRGQAGIQIVEPVTGDSLQNRDVRVSVVPWVEGLQPSTNFIWELWLNGQRLRTLTNRSTVVVGGLGAGTHTFEARLLSYNGVNINAVSDTVSSQVGLPAATNVSYQPSTIYTDAPMCPYVR